MRSGCRALWPAAAAVLIGVPASASGPVAPELGSFAPLDQEELVDPFTGDFRYAVPLMEVPGPNGGYPLVLNYASGITPDQDASWVGLGWTLSPGAIVRQMRGVPDDFAGEEIVTAHDIEPNVAYGLGIEGNYEIFGADSSVGTGLTAGLTGYFDNYRGFGITHTVGLSGQTKNEGTAASVGLNLSEDTLEGARVAASASLSLGDNMRFGADTAFDATRGLSALSFSAQAQYQSASYLVTTGNLVSYLGYAKPAQLPTTGREMFGSNIKVSFKIGGEVYGNYLSGKMFGYYNYEALKAKVTNTRTFGFLHLDAATPADALDFNRERDGALHDQSPNLALPVLTHDLFVMSGRDVLGTFRAYRNDVPVVFDPAQSSELSGGAIGVDVGFGNVVKVGVAGALNRTSTQIKRWDAGGANELLDEIKQGFTDDPTGYRERTYFKLIGEPSASSPARVAGAPGPVAVGLREAFDFGSVPQKFFATDPNSLTLEPLAGRVPRATLIQSFTNGELRTQANALPEFKRDFAPLAAETVRRDNQIGGFRVTAADGVRHIYGIAVYNLSYEEQKFSVDRTACGAGPCSIIKPPPSTPLNVPGAIYDYGVANSEKLFESKKLPAYPTSYLLTAVLGTDYIDADNIPGPSDGDHGYWVRFNYVREQTPQGAVQPFKWRIPYVGASFVRGPDNGRFIGGKQRLSDKGYVTLGERESWYLASVETATHKAFLCAARNVRTDAIGAVARDQNVTPGSGFARPWQLTQVKLYAKSMLPAAATGCPSARPLVAANLEYDNSLAKQAPNAPNGKLTLRKLYFTHQGNSRGRLSPYEFHYDSTDPPTSTPAIYNPPYADAGHDRWEVYRDPAVKCGGSVTSIAAQPMPALVDDEMPTCQNSAAADQWSSAWTLRRVVEPSGRIVRVDYEADDYAYVQDRPATRLFPLLSVNRDAPGGSARLCPVWSGPSSPGAACSLQLNTTTQLPRVYFKLESPLTSATDPRCVPGGCDAWIERNYLDSNRQLYFRIRVALRPTDKWQTVSGYAQALRAGLQPGTTDVGWVELAPVHSNHPTGTDYNPLAHAAWQYLRLEQPELIHDGGGLNGAPGGDAIVEAARVLTLVDAIPDLVTMVLGVYPRWAGEGWGQSLDLAHSWIRLRDPDGVKKGGGTRVSRIRMGDGWSASTAQKEPDLETGYLYSYRLDDGSSSGVATYEPMVGGEENPLRRAKPFTDQVLLSSNYNLFAELPVGESHYPSPAVGYSRVVRRTLAAQADVAARVAANDCQNPQQNSRPRATSTGPTVYEFYTARDFPVRSSETPIDKRRPPLPQIVLIPLLGEITMNSVTASQGYSVVVNDMHGKQRRFASYEYTDQLDCSHPGAPDYAVRAEPVTETVFNYRATGGFGSGSADLNNADVATLFEDPSTRPAALGEQSDFVVDLRHNKTESFDGGINLNVDTFLVALYPLPIPVPMPNFGYSLSETRTVVTSRVTHRAGILDSTSVRQGAARMITRNERYDPLTGEPLLRTSDNAYGNAVYRYEMPARWTYARMGAGYDDVGRVIDLSGGVYDATSKRLSVTAPVAICTERPAQQVQGCLPLGTELAAKSAAGGVRLTFLGTDAATGMAVFAAQGDMSTIPSSAVVVRSGNRNQLSSTTDVIRALSNPLDPRQQKTCNIEGQQITQFKARGVLDAAHTTFADYWPNIGDEVPGAAGADEFTRGVRGIFRQTKDFGYLAERSQSRPVDLAKDGTFDLILFGPGDEPAACDPGWVKRLTRTRYAASGYATEDRNALSIPSAALHGARGKLLLATAANATRDEIGYEGFEWDRSAADPRLTIAPEEGNLFYVDEGAPTQSCGSCAAAGVDRTFLVSDLAHTGRRSLRVMKEPAFEQKRLNLVPGKRYVISGWISRGRADDAAADVATYARGANASQPVGLRVSFKAAGATAMTTVATFEPDGAIIDGWQRIEGTFEAPAGGERIWVQFLAGNAPLTGKPRFRPTPAYFDDVRVLPESASLESYVYDPDTLRVAARLDQNNFATFYRYAADGQLDLVRRETVRGILAKEEGRLHTRERP